MLSRATVVRAMHIFCYLLTYLSLPNACLCKVLPPLAFEAGQVRLVSQALPEGEVGSKFYVFALLFQAHRKARHTLFVAVSFFLAFLNDPVAIIFHYFLQVPLEEQDHQARLAPLESEVCTVNFCRK